MAKEIEVKFNVVDFRPIRRKLKNVGAKCLGRAFEKTEKILGLDPAQRIVLTYWHFWEEIQKRKYRL